MQNKRFFDDSDLLLACTMFHIEPLRIKHGTLKNTLYSVPRTYIILSNFTDNCFF